MQKFSKIITWAYLVVGIIFTVEIFLNWNTNKDKAIVSAAMAILAFFMFVFKIKFQNKRMNQE